MDDNGVVAALGDHGLLLLQDKKLQSAVQIITGGRVTGSWWSHPKAHAIYATLERVAEHPDVLVAKLVSKKVTLVHRCLWPAFLAVATGREAWQLEDLSKDAKQMLSKLDEGSSIRTGRPGWEGNRAAAPGVRRKATHRFGQARVQARTVGRVGETDRLRRERSSRGEAAARIRGDRHRRRAKTLTLVFFQAYCGTVVVLQPKTTLTPAAVPAVLASSQVAGHRCIARRPGRAGSVL